MEFSGERYLPEMDIDSEISIFHRQRYESILDICKGKKVLDAACGEGYGSNFIAEAAEQVMGIDISHEAIQNARKKYQKENLKYEEASVEKIPVEDNWADVIISYETIEHVAEPIQRKFLEEIKRILKKDGILIMSSPDKKNYSDIPKFQNEFHVHELYFEEFDNLIGKYFLYKKYYYQGMLCNSYIFDKKHGICGREKEIELRKPDDTRAEYLIVIAGSQKLKEDISSVIYDSSNMYYLLKEEILKLKERLGNPGKVIEQKENYICEQREKITEIEERLRETNGIVEQKENYICEQRKKIAEIEERLRETNGIVEQKENYICEQREKIAEIEEKLREINEVVEQKESCICGQRRKIEEEQSYAKEQEEKIKLINANIEQMKKEEQKNQDDFKKVIENIREELEKTKAELNINIIQKEKLKKEKKYLLIFIIILGIIFIITIIISRKSSNLNLAEEIFTLEQADILAKDGSVKITDKLENPVIYEGEEGSWDDTDVLNPSVIKKDGIYYNYYSGFDGEIWRTGLATSADGITWDKYEKNPILDLSEEGWDSNYIAANGSAILINNKVYYYYQGGENPCSIGLAISEDAGGGGGTSKNKKNLCLFLVRIGI